MNTLSVFVNGFSLYTLKSAVGERLSESLPRRFFADAAEDWQPSPASLSPRSRKRLSPQTLLGITAAEGISPELESDASWVFGSAFGEGETLKTILDALSGPEMSVRPLKFQNSVHNAASGQWTIVRKSQGAATSICAGAATAAASLLKASVQVRLEKASVGLVLYDAPLPFPLSTSHRVTVPGAVALALSPLATESTIARLDVEYHSGDDKLQRNQSNYNDTNPCLAMLPVLERLLDIGSGPVALPFNAGASLVVEVN